MNAPAGLTPTPDTGALAAFANDAWDERILPQLKDYIAIPAKSPMFDAEWDKRGLIDRTSAQLVDAPSRPHVLHYENEIRSG